MRRLITILFQWVAIAGVVWVTPKTTMGALIAGTVVLVIAALSWVTWKDG